MSAGNAQEIADIADFKGEQILCMLLDSSEFYVGLNLEVTTDLICMQTGKKGHVHS
jgi:hypothetical protein